MSFTNVSKDCAASIMRPDADCGGISLLWNVAVFPRRWLSLTTFCLQF